MLWCTWGLDRNIRIVPFDGREGEISEKTRANIYRAWIDPKGQYTQEQVEKLISLGTSLELLPLGILHNIISLSALTLFPISLAWIPAAISPRRRRLRRGQCPKCAYTLAGVPRVGTGVRCPECGTTWDTVDWRDVRQFDSNASTAD
ncbi:MAG: hypothetical protein AB7V21_04835 [Phycisphaerales bacterium]